MRRREFILLLGGTAGFGPLAVLAQPTDDVPHVGVLLPNPESDPQGQARALALRQGLEARGWTSGRNIQIDLRWGVNNTDKIGSVIAELIALKPKVILVSTSRVLGTLQKATRTIPIVFTGIYEPVTQGFVQSLAHPGGNTTGFTNVEASVGAKWLELLKEIAPGVRRVAFMADSNNPGPMQSFRSAEAAAPDQSVQIVKTGVHGPQEIEAAMVTHAREPGGGLIVPPDGFLVSYRDLIIELAARYRLPAIYGVSYFAAEGALITYGINTAELYRQAAEYVDRILHGEQPSNLPVQQPTKYDLMINLKTAKALGLTVLSQLLVRADQVIE
jgi:putative ABC transport system substrate-binding protein